MSNDAMMHGMRLTRADVEAAALYGAKASWPAGFTVYQRGSAADGLFIVLRGRIVLRSRVKAGRGFVPAIATVGETFGAEGVTPNAVYVTDAKADESSETLHLSGSRFRSYVREQPQRALSLIAQVMSERAGLLEKLRELSTLSVEQRIVSALVRMASTNTFVGADGRITLDATQYRLLCELVGATRESVSLVFARLVSDGLADRRGGGYVLRPASELSSRLQSSWREEEVPFPMGTDLLEPRAAL
jgi:CRP-like cAMP-binding protein